MTVSTLITGGAGFIGSRLARALIGGGHEVTVIDVLHPQVHRSGGRPADLPPEAQLLPADVTHGADWQAVLRLGRPEVVVHLAAETGTGQSLTEATRHGLVNVVGTTQMLDALMASGAPPDHLVLASSRAVYGEGPWETPGNPGVAIYPPPRRHADLVARIWDPVSPSGEVMHSRPARAATTAANPTNVYAATKLAQEHICRAWCAATGTALSVLRLQNVYGPGQSVHNAYTGIVTLFGRLALGGATLDVYEDGAIGRDFVFIDDVVAALAAAVARPPTESRLVDIGSGRPTTVGAVASLIAELTGAPDPQVSGRFRDGDVRAASCQIDDAMGDLGWAPTTELVDGLRSLLAWMADQPEVATTPGRAR